MTHTLPQPAAVTTAVAIGLAKDSELPPSLLQLLCSTFCLLFLSFFSFFFCLLVFCTCVCFGLSASLCGVNCQGTHRLTTLLGRRKRVAVCEISGSHSNTHLQYINNCITADNKHFMEWQSYLLSIHLSLAFYEMYCVYWQTFGKLPFIN